MDPNTKYYRENARSFFDSTAFVDMSALHDAFLSKLLQPLTAARPKAEP